jgi:hypothetical protein
MVYDKISPMLDDHVAMWLKDKCSAI